MKQKLIVLFALAVMFGIEIKAQERQVPIYDFESFAPLMQQQNDTLYVLNFWATWCRPCVAELPYFEKINSEYADKKLKVILVSLDFSENLETMVIPFLQKRNIRSDVVLLEEADPNSWIDKVSPQWSGAIPATLIYRNEKSAFYEQEFSYEELEQIILNF